MNNNISPHFYVLATFSVVAATLLLFENYGFREEYFYIPIFALAIIYGIINFIRQQQGLSEFTIATKIHIPTLFKKAIARFVVWFIFIYLAYLFFDFVPYYSSSTYRPNQLFLDYFLNIYLIVGLPYFLLTGIFKASRVEDYYDPAIRVIHMLKQVLIRALRGDDTKSIFRVFRKKYNRKVLLNLVMRTYFIPVMVVQLYSNITLSMLYTSTEFSTHQFLIILYWLAAVLWIADILNASLSYCIESRWVENRTRSIDMTFGGWAVCLFCYAPLNMATGYIFPFAPNVVTDNPTQLVYDNLTFLYTIKIIELVVLVAHIYTDISLGPSIANITLKKLQTKGFYGIIRHPGTTFKLLFWLIQSCFYKSFWSIKYLFGYSMWFTIYILRALTEERHLNQHEEYQEYKKKVKYRFIPKIF